MFLNAIDGTAGGRQGGRQGQARSVADPALQAIHVAGWVADAAGRPQAVSWTLPMAA